MRYRLLKFVGENSNDPLIIHIYHHGCWWHDDTRTQGSNIHDINIHAVIAETVEFSSSGYNYYYRLDIWRYHITRYRTQYTKFDGKISVRLWSHGRHPYLALTGELWGSRELLGVVIQKAIGMKTPHTWILDLSAAFDTIDHHCLLHILESSFGIQGNVLAWFQSYLTGRTQTVHINKCTSEPHELKYGVPQGSVLGPILFTIYTTPLGKLIRRHGLTFHLYADDTQLYLAFKPSEPSSIDNNISRLEKCV